jgi:hydroxymethylbilane synthase
VKFRLGTRGSRLALVQSESVAARLRALGAQVDIVPIRTSGDRLAQVALAEFGGKALFVKEIEDALLEGDIDIAVHSLKDVPGVLPAGLALGAFPPREDPRDALLTRMGGGLMDLAPGSRIGTSSLRRRVLVLACRRDLAIEPIRGNVDTRLAKLEQGRCDGVILAKAGLDRLGAWPAHAVALSAEQFVPAVGQGVLAIELREADRERLEVLSEVDDTRTRMEALAERSYLAALGAGCHTPVAGHARLDGDRLTVTGLVAGLDGDPVLRSTRTGPASAAPSLGADVARDLLARGAAALIEKAIG